VADDDWFTSNARSVRFEHLFDEQLKVLGVDPEWLDDAMVGLDLALAKHPEIFPMVPGTNLSCAKLVVYKNAPPLRVFFTYDATEVRVICVESLRSDVKVVNFDFMQPSLLPEPEGEVTERDSRFVLDYPEAELVFGLVFAVGTDYKPVLSYLEDYIRLGGYVTNKLQISEWFPDSAARPTSTGSY
jgi:hypothetical protein